MTERAHIAHRVGMAGIFLFAFSIPVSFVPAELGIGIAAGGWLVEGLFRRKLYVRWNPFFIPLLVYLCWNILSAGFSPRPSHSVLAVVDNEWPSVLMLMMVWLVRKEEDLRTILWLFLGVSSMAMVYAVWQTFSGIELYRSMDLTPIDGLFRNVGFYSFYLTFAAFAMTVFLLSASLSLEGSDKIRRVAAVIALLSLAAIIGSFARSVWLALLVTGPLLGFVKGRRIGAIVISTLLILVVLLMASVPAFRNRAASIIDIEQNETRLNLWKTSIAMAGDRPLVGVGQDNFDFFFEQYRVKGFYDTATHPHNDYLNVLVSSGIPGLLAFISMWGIALWTGYLAWTRGKTPLLRGTAMGAGLGLLGFLVAGFFQNYYGTFANCLGWWFIAGLIFVCYELGEKKSSSDRGEEG